ncbi:MAG TPA: hypothetical protein VG897_08265 [Terriglobales bacterium]|nr:hypothetical protein [Terriglobales bacterium]
MKPKWWWTRAQVLAQLHRWEHEKDAWFERRISALVHTAYGYGMDKSHIIKCLNAAAKTVERIS